MIEYKNIADKAKLKPEEIRLLHKCHKKKATVESLPTYFNNYDFEIADIISKLINIGLLKLSDYEFELKKLTVDELKGLMRRKQISAKGKKERLVEAILTNYSEEELKNLKLQRYFVLTEKGADLIKQNEALLLAYNGLSQCIVSDNEIAEAQEKYIYYEGVDLLILLYQKHKDKEINILKNYPKDVPLDKLKQTYFNILSLCQDLKKLYMWKKDDFMKEYIESVIDDIDKRLELIRTEHYRKIAGKLNIDIESLDAMRLKVDEELKEHVTKENDITDVEYEKYIYALSLQLENEDYRKEFLKVAQKCWERKHKEGALSAKEMAFMTFTSMKKAEIYYKNHKRREIEEKEIQRNDFLVQAPKDSVR